MSTFRRRSLTSFLVEKLLKEFREGFCDRLQHCKFAVPACFNLLDQLLSQFGVLAAPFHVSDELCTVLQSLVDSLIDKLPRHIFKCVRQHKVDVVCRTAEKSHGAEKGQNRLG